MRGILAINVCCLLLALTYAYDEEINCDPTVPRKPPKVSLTEKELAEEDKADPKKSTSIFNFTTRDTFGNVVKMDKYKGHVVLIVNIASKCALAKRNYEKLTKLNETYYEKGLRIISFPCNQFGYQMPEQNGEDMICHLRSKNAEYGDVMAKIHVNGDYALPLYQFLKRKQGGFILNRIKWNFTKFLVDKNGVPVKRFAPTADPLALTKDIEALL